MRDKCAPVKWSRLPNSLRSMGGLTSARTFGFRGILRYGTPSLVARVKQTLTQGQAFEVLARRPGFLSIREADLRPEERLIKSASDCAALKPFGVFISNGVHQLELDPLFGKYIYGPAAPFLAGIRTGMGLPAIFEPAVLFSAEPLKGFRTFGQRRLELGIVDGFLKRLPTYDVILNIAAESRRPVRISVFWRSRRKKPSLFFSVDFKDWQFDIPIPRDTFDPTPPSGAVPIHAKVSHLNLPSVSPVEKE
jgi:hypothetical protein